jgi:hypothetical protein
VTTGGIRKRITRAPAHVHDGADGQVDDAGDEDAEKGGGVVAVGSALDRQDGADEREGRTQVTGHPAAGDGEEDQRGDAAEEDHGVGVEADDERHEDRGAEHDHDVLEPQEERLRAGQPFLGIDDPGLRRLRCGNRH